MISRKAFYVLVAITVLVLSVPFIAMQVSDQVNWSTGDFLVMGILFFGVGLLTAFLLERFKDSKYKSIVIVLAVITVVLVWAELAVGIFGTPFAGS